ncbi:hypothetical protein MXD61_17175 [Frankia sp. AgPm24]|uniref:hypothetical protein n=1 Tax=Frankia sp. AgPm24 TaxID=631128 RepID=UPI00200CA3B4|nr:hypothetical protein [Frankia sp. AgPm24]MCK9923580.1 hypothetical protein [Frankia sp. AgPm24]
MLVGSTRRPPSPAAVAVDGIDGIGEVDGQVAGIGEVGGIGEVSEVSGSGSGGGGTFMVIDASGRGAAWTWSTLARPAAPSQPVRPSGRGRVIPTPPRPARHTRPAATGNRHYTP